MEHGSKAARGWRVGVLFSQTGVTAGVERTQLNATLLAIDEINATGGVLDRPIEPLIYDPESSPKTIRVLAERLLRTDQVRLIFGCYMSSTRKSVLPLIETHKGLLFYPTLYEGFEYSAHCIYTGAAPNQNSLQLARFLLEHYGNRFLLVGSNYVYPYESNRVMADLVRQNGGKVLDELYVPLDAKADDFARVMREIGRTTPDVIFSTVVGAATALLYQAYRAAGLDPARRPIASLTTSEAEVADMSAEAAEGHVTAAPFFETLRDGDGAAFRGRLQGALRCRRPGAGRGGGGLFPGPPGGGGAGAGRHRRAGPRPGRAARRGIPCPAGPRAHRPGKQPHLSVAARGAAGRAGKVPAGVEPRDARAARSLFDDAEPGRLVS